MAYQSLAHHQTLSVCEGCADPTKPPASDQLHCPGLDTVLPHAAARLTSESSIGQSVLLEVWVGLVFFSPSLFYQEPMERDLPSSWISSSECLSAEKSHRAVHHAASCTDKLFLPSTPPLCFDGAIADALSPESMKTVSVALVLCLNVGVDPPDVVKTSPCARLECWIDPLSMSPQKALETIGANLQKQYENWQPRQAACSLPALSQVSLWPPPVFSATLFRSSPLCSAQLG
ncbi:hypothetical protein ACEWY4_018200 [Coilia grayii]|uniref:Raptor N-terminal CASPase-like domain-containing protein n=1 Tax=Coilia grayii TaxID=363190 RepID=A0ABD1JLT0_9TELE